MSSVEIGHDFARVVVTDSARNQLVVTGSSAGGIEAISRVLAGIPKDFPAPIVIAQHLDPRVPSSLAVILAKRTTLEIVVVEDTAVLKPGTAYVVPADRHVEITDGWVHVHVNGIHGRPKPSIDLLFASAAAAFGERLIAVVLSGLGSDGSEGARSVKQHGGTVIIEDPMSAAFPSMPASLEPAMVDFVIPIDRIAAELISLVNESIDIPDDLPSLANLLERIRSTSGIDFAHYKLPTIKRRLAQQIAASGRKTLDAYLTYLAQEPAEYSRLVSAFLIKVTEFFRDGATFDALRETVLPDIFEQARRRGAHELRIWSAGCSTGEEAYSLAILAAEALRDREFLNVRIFATDVDEAAITFARRGIYPRESVARLEPHIVERYFTQAHDGWEVNKNIRNMMVFGQHDLGQRAPFPRIDLAVCRNVLIYFSKALQQRTLQIFAYSLRNGGYLALGRAETTSPLAEYFTPVDATLRIFRRHGERVALIAAQGLKPGSGRPEVERKSSPFPAFAPSARDGRSTINEKLGAFLTSSSIGVILVDRRYDILAINTSARAMFDIHGVAVGDDLVHLMSADTAAGVRALLDAALRHQEPDAGGEELAIHTDDAHERRYVRIKCYPEIDDATHQVVGAVILSVDVTDLSLAQHELQTTIESQNRELVARRSSEAHARERQHSLVEANKQLADVNSDLRAHNDALVIDAEEAQAATEEIEALNEEMQATNEELETLNEEFQATIEELNTSNAEHESRSVELQEQLTLRDAQYRTTESTAAALASIVDGLSKAVAAVDATGTIIVANERFRAIQNGAPESSVQIEDDAGATIPLGVVLRRAGEGQAFRFSYRSIAADQTLTMYHGRTVPSQSGATRGIVELEAGEA